VGVPASCVAQIRVCLSWLLTGQGSAFTNNHLLSGDLSPFLTALCRFRVSITRLHQLVLQNALASLAAASQRWSFTNDTNNDSHPLLTSSFVTEAHCATETYGLQPSVPRPVTVASSPACNGGPHSLGSTYSCRTGEIHDLVRCCLLMVFMLLTIAPAHAAFTRPATWKLNSIEQALSGAWCFIPGANAEPVHECQDSALKQLLDVHTNNMGGAGLSVEYYDLDDNSALGGAAWRGWNTTVLPVGLCMSGSVTPVSEPQYLTICRLSYGDDDHDLPSAHVGQCAVAHPQNLVSDGCYHPPHHGASAVARLNVALVVLGAVASIIGIGTFLWTIICCLRKRRTFQLSQANGLETGNVKQDGAVCYEVKL